MGMIKQRPDGITINLSNRALIATFALAVAGTGIGALAAGAVGIGVAGVFSEQDNQLNQCHEAVQEREDIIKTQNATIKVLILENLLGHQMRGETTDAPQAPAPKAPQGQFMNHRVK